MTTSDVHMQSSSILRLQYLNSFFRGISVNTSQVYFTALFISLVGAQNYSSLFLYSTLASIVFYVASIFLKAKSSHYVYLFIALCFLTASMFFPMYKIPVVVYVTVLLSFLSDMAGVNMANTSVQLTVSPAFLRKALTKTTSIDIATKVAGSVISIVALRYDMPALFFLIFWPTLILHILVFARISARLDRDSIVKETPRSLKLVSDSFAVIFGNRLLRFFLYISMWAFGMKFVVEFSFFKELEVFYPHAKDLGPFFGFLNMGTLVLTLAFQKLVLPKLVTNLRMSSLFSILPLGVLSLTFFFAFVGHFYAATALFLFFQIVNRGLQVPLSREVFSMVQEQFKKNVAFIVSLVLAAGGLVISSGASAYRSEMNIMHSVLLIALLTTPIIFLLSGIGSEYLDTLWNTLKEKIKTSSHISDAVGVSFSVEGANLKTSTRMKTNALIMSLKNSKSDADANKMAKLIETYYRSRDRDDLFEASQIHIKLLSSTSDDDVELGLILCEMIGLACFEPRIKVIADDHSSKMIRDLAKSVLDSIDFLSRYHLAGLTIETQTKLRFLMTKSFQTGNLKQRTALKNLIKHPHKKTVTAFVNAIFDTRYKDIRKVLVECANQDSGHLSLVPLFQAICMQPVAKTNLLREFLSHLNPWLFRFEINLFLSRELSDLAHLDDNHLGTARNRFVHLLFLNEWLLLGRVRDELHTIEQIFEPASEDVLLIRNLHQEIIKKSLHHQKWKEQFLRFAVAH